MTAIGLMSGTSMDGIDAAVLVTDGEGMIRPGPSLSRPYDPGLREELRRVVAHATEAPDIAAYRRELGGIEARLTALNAEVVTALMAKAGLRAADVDVIGYHGQTVLHRPAAGITVQIGDGGALAARCGVTVVNDFRAADVAAGGEGAPFAPAYHRALAAATGVLPQVVVNVGGVANVTWLGEDGDPIAFDTGPGNALIDDYVRDRNGDAFDRDGRLGASGRVDERALGELLAHPYFSRRPPKSLDRNEFSAEPIKRLPVADAVATLVAFTARAIARAAEHFPGHPKRWVVAGGGRLNAAIMAALRREVAAPVMTAEEAGWRGGEVEAEAFAYLAVRSLKGLPLSWPTTTGVPRPLTGGVVHHPPNRRLSA